jgi:hypothetical protein
VRASPAFAPLLLNHQLVKATEEDLGRQKSAQLAAQRALDHDGLEWELPNAGWNVAAASFARDNEGLAA